MITPDKLTEEERRELDAFLHQNGYLKCDCGQALSSAAIRLIDSCTEYGTPLTYLEIKCPQCDMNIEDHQSWWPAADDFDDLLRVFHEMIEQSSSSRWV